MISSPRLVRALPFAFVLAATAVWAAPPSAPPDYQATPPERVGVLAPGTGIPVGQQVPDVRARTLDGQELSLSSLYGRQPILLVVYRGGWCPYCNAQLHALTQAYPEYRKRGVEPVAVSVDKPEPGAKLKATYEIPFPVLSDSDAAVLTAFHVVRTVGAEEMKVLTSYGVDLEAYSGRAHHQMAVPSVFLIDRKGVVRWAHSDPEYKVRPSTEQLLAAIDAAHLAAK